MRYGFVLPYGDAHTAAELAGWDGFFVWEPVWGIDGWACLTAGESGTSPKWRSASASMGGR